MTDNYEIAIGSVNCVTITPVRPAGWANGGTQRSRERECMARKSGVRGEEAVSFLGLGLLPFFIVLPALPVLEFFVFGSTLPGALPLLERFEILAFLAP